MIGIWKSYADIYLMITGIVMLVAFGIPLTLVPMRWARAFRWEVSQPTQLVIFFGRSVGVLLSVLAIYALIISQMPAAIPFYFNLLLLTLAGMLLLHVYGAIRRTQPITETVEIALWVFLGIVTLLFYP